MRVARRWLSRLLGLVRRDRADREFADEIETLVAMHIEEHRRAGLPPAAAERRARLAVGSVPALVESRRDGRSVPSIEALIQDVPHRCDAFASSRRLLSSVSRCSDATPA